MEAKKEAKTKSVHFKSKEDEKEKQNPAIETVRKPILKYKSSMNFLKSAQSQKIKKAEEAKPKTAFFLFCEMKRAESKGKKLSILELSQMYKSLSNVQKDEFIKQYNESIKEYNMILESLHEIDEVEEEEKKGNRKKKAKTSKKAHRKGNMRACNCGKCQECKNYIKKRAREELEEDEE